MKLLQTIPGFGVKSGGTSTCTYDLLKSLHEQGCDVSYDFPSMELTQMGENGNDWWK